MPSPFPGMDPYLEGDLWTTVHAQLASEIARQLAPKLRPRYVALNEKRFIVDSHDADDGIAVAASDLYPDTGIVTEAIEPQGGTATALAVAPIQVRTLLPERVPVHWVEIRDVKRRRLVTAIEVLSPVNKHGEGLRKYMRRRNRIYSSTANLVEIDLTRRGQRVPTVRPLPAHPYFVFLSRTNRRPIMDVWPVALADRLPTVPVPLMHGDADVLLDLQQALTSIYDLFGYDLLADYTQPPDVPLTDQEAQWAKDVLNIPRAARDE